MGDLKRTMLLGLLFLLVSTSGCLPAFTSCKGNLQILTPEKDIQERFVVVSFWDYPQVNEKKGKVVINEVILTNNKSMTAKFPTKAYMVVWTPALGTQHLAPDPGIMVFHKNYSPSWNVGGTESDIPRCCGPPKSRHEFAIELFDAEEVHLPTPSLMIYSKVLFEEFMDAKEDLTKEMDKCKGLTEEEKVMVLQKLSQTAKTLELEMERLGWE